jgi:hypothetical protein
MVHIASSDTDGGAFRLGIGVFGVHTVRSAGKINILGGVLGRIEVKGMFRVNATKGIVIDG